jgi:hypothetical protein
MGDDVINGGGGSAQCFIQSCNLGGGAGGVWRGAEEPLLSVESGAKIFECLNETLVQRAMMTDEKVGGNPKCLKI